MRLETDRHAQGQFGEAGDLDAVTTIRGAGDDPTDENDFIVPFHFETPLECFFAVVLWPAIFPLTI
jgi:hypothetical protein